MNVDHSVTNSLRNLKEEPHTNTFLLLFILILYISFLVPQFYLKTKNLLSNKLVQFIIFYICIYICVDDITPLTTLILTVVLIAIFQYIAQYMGNENLTILSKPCSCFCSDRELNEVLEKYIARKKKEIEQNKVESEQITLDEHGISDELPIKRKQLNIPVTMSEDVNTEDDFVQHTTMNSPIAYNYTQKYEADINDETKDIKHELIRQLNDKIKRGKWLQMKGKNYVNEGKSKVEQNQDIGHKLISHGELLQQNGNAMMQMANAQIKHISADNKILLEKSASDADVLSENHLMLADRPETSSKKNMREGNTAVIPTNITTTCSTVVEPNTQITEILTTGTKNTQDIIIGYNAASHAYATL
jgi:hypothetical protein